MICLVLHLAASARRLLIKCMAGFLTAIDHCAADSELFLNPQPQYIHATARHTPNASHAALKKPAEGDSMAGHCHT